MDRPALTRMQIRVVLTVFRAEMARLNRVDPVGAGFDAGRRLRLRSIELLDQARARLNGEGISQPELLDELQSAREEVGGEAPVGAVPDRHGGTVDPVTLAVARPAVKPEVGGRQPRRP